MRVFQVALLVLGVLALVAAIPFIGSDTGDALWRAGIAVFLLDVVCIMLWPRRPRGPAPPPEGP